MAVEVVKGEKLPLLGAIISGVSASACCLGPLIVAMLGLGSASLFIKMAPYRSIFGFITIALLLWAGLKRLKGKKQCLASGCAPKKPIMFWTLGGLAVVLLILPELLSYLM